MQHFYLTADTLEALGIHSASSAFHERGLDFVRVTSSQANWLLREVWWALDESSPEEKADSTALEAWEAAQVYVSRTTAGWEANVFLNGDSWYKLTTDLPGTEEAEHPIEAICLAAVAVTGVGEAFNVGIDPASVR